MAEEDIGALLVRIEADMKDFQTKMEKAAQMMDDNAKKANSFSGQLKNAFSFAGGFAIFETIKRGFEQSIVAGFEFDKTMQSNKIALESMTGSAQKADSILGKLAKMAAETPFEFPQLATATKKMLAYGFELDKIPGMLKNIGDAASGLSLGADGVDRITIALGQMQAKGKVQAQEMMQLTEAGIPAWDILAKAMGKSTAEVMKLSEKGLLPARKAIDALVEGMEQRFPNMMEKQSKSFDGLMSTIKDDVQMTFGAIVQPAFDELTNTILPDLIKGLDSVRVTVGREGVGAAVLELTAEFGTFSSIAAGVLATIVAYKVISTIDGLMKAWKASTIAMQLAQGGLNAVLAANPIGAVATAIGLLIAGISALVLSQRRAIDEMKAQLIEGYEKEKEVALANIDEQHKSRLDSLNKQLTAEQDAHDTRLANIQSEGSKAVKSMGDQEQALKKSVQEKLSILEKAHNETIDKIRAEYGVVEEVEKSKTDIVREEAQKRIEAIDKEEQAAEDAYNKAIEKIREEYGVFEKTEKSKTEVAQEERKKRLETINEQEKAAEDAYNESIRKIREEYGVVKSTEKSKVELAQETAKKKIELLNEEIKAAEDSYKAQLVIAKDTYNEMLREAENVYREKMKLLYDEDLDEKIKTYQDQIDELDNKTKEEDKILKQQQEAQKLLDLQAKIDNAKTLEDKLVAQKAYNEELNTQARERELELRKTQIESLKEQIKEVQESARKGNQILSEANAAKKLALDQELVEAKQRATDQLTAVQISEDDKLTKVRQRITDAKIAIDAELRENLDKIDIERRIKEAAEADKLQKTKNNLAGQRTQIDTDTDTNIKKIQSERLAKETAEGDKLKKTKDNLAGQRTKIDEETATNIRKIQEERIAKETAEDKKYDAAKGALDRQLDYIDKSYKPAYQARLDEELRMKQKLENDKYDAAKKALDEQITYENGQMEAQKKKVEEETKAKEAKAEEEAKKKLNEESNKTNQNNLEMQYKLYEDTYGRSGLPRPGTQTNPSYRPAFAAGVMNFRGGAALVGEKGPEIVELPKGANVYSNDKTREMLGSKSIIINQYITDRATADYATNSIVRVCQGRGLEAAFR